MRYRDFIGMMRKQAAEEKPIDFNVPYIGDKPYPEGCGHGIIIPTGAAYEKLFGTNRTATRSQDAGIGYNPIGPKGFYGMLRNRNAAFEKEDRARGPRLNWPFWDFPGVGDNTRATSTTGVPETKGDVGNLGGFQINAASENMFGAGTAPGNTFRNWLGNKFLGRNYNSYKRTAKLAPELDEGTIEKDFLTPEMKPIWDAATPEERKRMLQYINGLVYNGRGRRGNKVVG